MAPGSKYNCAAWKQIALINVLGDVSSLKYNVGPLSWYNMRKGVMEKSPEFKVN